MTLTQLLIASIALLQIGILGSLYFLFSVLFNILETLNSNGVRPDYFTGK